MVHGKKGFTCLTGVVFVLSVDTGEVLDYHVLSKSRPTYTINRGHYNSDDELEEWQIEHIASGAVHLLQRQKEPKFYGTRQLKNTICGINGCLAMETAKPSKQWMTLTVTTAKL